MKNSEVETKVCALLEDKRALEVIERTLKMVDGQLRVPLLWRSDPPYLPNNKVVAERRGLLLKKRLQIDEVFFDKYKATISVYIDKGHAEGLEVKDRPILVSPSSSCCVSFKARQSESCL